MPNFFQEKKILSEWPFCIFWQHNKIKSAKQRQKVRNNKKFLVLYFGLRLSIPIQKYTNYLHFKNLRTQMLAFLVRKLLVPAVHLSAYPLSHGACLPREGGGAIKKKSYLGITSSGQEPSPSVSTVLKRMCHGIL
jgi:hypothetical protein